MGWVLGRLREADTSTRAGWNFTGEMDEFLITSSEKYTDSTFTLPSSPYNRTELYAQDSGDNHTKLSPHNSDGEWEYYSENKITGKKVRINMEKMIRKLEEITGETFIKNE
jgi:hypothetical protein